MSAKHLLAGAHLCIQSRKHSFIGFYTFSPFQLTHRLVPLSFDVHVDNDAIIIWIGPTLKKTHLLCPNCQNITLFRVFGIYSIRVYCDGVSDITVLSVVPGTSS